MGLSSLRLFFFFLPKWNPCLRILGEKETHYGSTSPHALTCEYHPWIKNLLSLVPKADIKNCSTWFVGSSYGLLCLHLISSNLSLSLHFHRPIGQHVYIGFSVWLKHFVPVRSHQDPSVSLHGATKSTHKQTTPPSPPGWALLLAVKPQKSHILHLNKRQVTFILLPWLASVDEFPGRRIINVDLFIWSGRNKQWWILREWCRKRLSCLMDRVYAFTRAGMPQFNQTISICESN